MQDLMICRSAPRSPEFSGCTEHWNFKCCLATVWAGAAWVGSSRREREREGCLSERAPHLLFVALDGSHCEGDGWTFQGAADCSWSPHGFKDPTLVAATSGLLETTCCLKTCLCSSASSFKQAPLGFKYTAVISLFPHLLVFWQADLFFVVHILPSKTVYYKPLKRMLLKQNKMFVSSCLLWL